MSITIGPGYMGYYGYGPVNGESSSEQQKPNDSGSPGNNDEYSK